MTFLMILMNILIVTMSILMVIVAFQLLFNKSNKYTEVKFLVDEIISQNSFLYDNINNLSNSVSILHDEVEIVKKKNEDLGSQIEKVRDILKDIIKSKDE